jgi:hypothetical protein
MPLKAIIVQDTTVINMAIEHTQEFGIYHWDTFDNTTVLVDEATTLQKAIHKVKKRYKGRLDSNCADRVDIVNLNGDVVEKYQVK